MLATAVKMLSKRQIIIPKDVRDSLHWDIGEELVLSITKYGVLLQTKPLEKKLTSATSLRGFLQHNGKTVPVEQLGI